MKTCIFLIFLFVGSCGVAIGQITVDENHAYLVSKKDKKPFFWLGDTGWELFMRLTREEAVHYLDVRKKQGFNVVMSVALAELDGIRKGNRYGDGPFKNIETLTWDVTPGKNPDIAEEYDYWDHMDFVIKEAAKRDIYIGLLPSWGDKVVPGAAGPVIFTNEKPAYDFAEKLAKRYSGQWNIIWILGGDRSAVYYEGDGPGDKIKNDYRPIWRAMAKAIQSVAGEDVFITYHPSWPSTANFLGGETWLSMNALQSGHGSRTAEAWTTISEDLQKLPKRPIMDLEPCYEDHPVNVWDGKWTRKERGYFNDYDVRARIYRGVFAGGCGAVYGHHQIWQFVDTLLNPPIWVGDTIIGWEKALSAKAANQIHFLKELMLSRPDFDRVQDRSLIASPHGKDYTDLIVATRNKRGTYAMIYLPQPNEIKINLDNLKEGEKRITWYNPVNGKSTRVKGAYLKGVESFIPPQKAQKDWILVVDVK